MTLDSIRTGKTNAAPIGRPGDVAGADAPAPAAAAGNLSAAPAAALNQKLSTPPADRAEALAFSGVTAPSAERAAIGSTDTQALIGRLGKPAMAEVAITELILLLEEVIRTLKAKTRQAQQAEGDAALTTDLGAVQKMRDSAKDKLSASNKSSTFQMVAGAVQGFMAAMGGLKLGQAGKAASKMKSLNNSIKADTKALKLSTDKAVKSELRLNMKLAREQSAGMKNIFDKNLQSAGAYTGAGGAIGGVTSGLGTRLAGEATYESDKENAEVAQQQSVSRRQTTAQQMRSDEVAQLEALRNKLLETVLQMRASSGETQKALIRV